MKVLVVGGGGREHALVWKLTRERSVDRVFCAPGNPGIPPLAQLVQIRADDVDGLAAFAARERIDLTVVGPELPLNAGIADTFAARGLRIFGPSRSAAQLECSKVFAKAFMARHGIPTARYRACESAEEARAIVSSGELGLPVVVKADGLAAGKGVVVAPGRDEALRAIAEAMDSRRFGDAGSRVVLEECLSGPEVSFFALCDGRTALPLLTAQDHKRAFDNDEGPNTGGMGAFAPSPLITPERHAQIMRDVVEPVVSGMRADGHEYRGFLYAGLMLTCDGPKVIEFNVRLGDPEAQVVLPLVEEDLAPRLAAAADGTLPATPIRLREGCQVGVVLASKGYPGEVQSGGVISGLDAQQREDQSKPIVVFHSGTALDPQGNIITAGGRVLTVVGSGVTYAEAITRAYDGVSRISFEGMHYRRDIGRAVAGSR